MKKILLIICILFLTGCTAVYEVDIKDDKIIEKLTLIENDKTLFDKRNDAGWTLRDIFDSLINHENEFSNDPYKIKSLNTDDRLGVEYTSSAAKSILNSSILNQCYINPVVKTVDGIVTIETGNNFECYNYYENMDTVKIILKTNHEVISSNADEIDGNFYIWNLTKDSNKNIKLSYYEKTIDNSINMTFIIVIIFIILIILLGIYIFINKNKKNNSF